MHKWKMSTVAMTLAITQYFAAIDAANASGQPVFDWVNWLLEKATRGFAEEIRDLHIDELTAIGAELEHIASAANPDIKKSFSDIRDRISKLQATNEAFRNLIDAHGGIEKSLEKFDSYNTFKQQPCFHQGTCTAEEISRIRNARYAMQELMRTAAVSSMRETQEQTESIEKDAEQLQHLENKAARAKGQTQAIKYGNEISAARTKELIQIRASINSIQRIDAIRQHAQAQDRSIAMRRFNRFKGIEQKEERPKK